MKITLNFDLRTLQAIYFVDEVFVPFVAEMHMKMNNGKIVDGSKRAQFYYRCLSVSSALGQYYGNNPHLTKPRWYRGVND